MRGLPSCKECGDPDDHNGQPHSYAARPQSQSRRAREMGKLPGRASDVNKLVEVRCPHLTGLCWQLENGALANLPCPCNDPSVILREITSPAEFVELCPPEGSMFDPDRNQILAMLATVEHLNEGDGNLGVGQCDQGELHDPHIWRDALDYPLLCDGGRPSPEQVEEFLS